MPALCVAVMAALIIAGSNARLKTSQNSPNMPGGPTSPLGPTGPMAPVRTWHALTHYSVLCPIKCTMVALWTHRADIPDIRLIHSSLHVTAMALSSRTPTWAARVSLVTLISLLAYSACNTETLSCNLRRGPFVPYSTTSPGSAAATPTPCTAAEQILNHANI